MADVLLDTLIDCLKILPFLFLTYLLMEYLEHRAGEKATELMHGSGRFGPVIGGVLGVVPQCGFSAAVSNLYAGGVITRGTLLAVFLSTSDEMLPILISERAPAGFVFKVLAVKALVGIIAGLVIDAVARRAHDYREPHIHDICEDKNCHCDEKGVLVSALIHTGQIIAFIFIITLVLNAVIFYVGEERLAGIILNRPVIGELIAGVVGLIPNCAASVVITQLYLQGAMSVGAMLSGLLVGSGVGLLVLFRMNRNPKDNVKTLVMLYVIGVVCGTVIGLLPIF
ncbi:MAG: arsenic efflux protein [Oscillospiraceae bacterium]|nr:arsenic efflux protein [Oscillospiraceae bacterium]